MTAPAPQSQPTAERLWCTACGTVTADGLCDCNRWNNKMSSEPHFVNYADAMQEAAHEQAQENASLKARAEQAEQAVDVLESNAREQAMLLADTGRRVEDLARTLLAAREYVAGASLAAGTPAYIRCCELLIKIDAALPHVLRDPARAPTEPK